MLVFYYYLHILLLKISFASFFIFNIFLGFKSAWIHAVLHNGFYIDELQNHFRSAFEIDGQEVQWVI